MERRSGFWARFHHDEEAFEAPAPLWCPRCGGEFRADVTVCADCGVPLTAEAPSEVDQRVAEQDPVALRAEAVEYDLSDWTRDQVAELQAELGFAYIPHEWGAGQHLRVDGRREAEVDDLVDAIDEMQPLEGEVVEYELPDWTPQQRDQLAERLVALDVNCRWDGYLLSVGEADEARVDAEVTAIDPSFSTEAVDDGFDDFAPEEDVAPTLRQGIVEWGTALGDAAERLPRF